jgi:hypothetical protein
MMCGCGRIAIDGGKIKNNRRLSGDIKFVDTID